MGYAGAYLGSYVGAYLGSVGEVEWRPHWASYLALMAIDDVANSELELDDNTATVELDEMPYIIKAGDLAPSIAGSITPPSGIDLDGVTFTMVYRNRDNGRVYSVTATNDGDAGHAGTWDWHYDWVSGDTANAGTYDVGIRTTVSGDQMTFPNTSWATFTIEPQL